MPARSKLTFDGQLDYSGGEDWERHVKDVPISDSDLVVTPNDRATWLEMHRQLTEELTQYCIRERQFSFTHEEAQVLTVPLGIPWFSMMLSSLVEKTLSLAMHRCASWLDAHYDIAATQEKKAEREGNQALRTFWKFRRLLALQLRDGDCRDIKSTIYPPAFTESGVINPPVVGDSR